MGRSDPASPPDHAASASASEKMATYVQADRGVDVYIADFVNTQRDVLPARVTAPPRLPLRPKLIETPRLEIYAWGANKEGQLGTGDRDGRTHPVRVMATALAQDAKNMTFVGIPSFSVLTARDMAEVDLRPRSVGLHWPAWYERARHETKGGDAGSVASEDMSYGDLMQAGRAEGQRGLASVGVPAKMSLASRYATAGTPGDDDDGLPKPKAMAQAEAWNLETHMVPLGDAIRKEISIQATGHRSSLVIKGGLYVWGGGKAIVPERVEQLRQRYVTDACPGEDSFYALTGGNGEHKRQRATCDALLKPLKQLLDANPQFSGQDGDDDDDDEISGGNGGRGGQKPKPQAAPRPGLPPLSGQAVRSLPAVASSSSSSSSSEPSEPRRWRRRRLRVAEIMATVSEQRGEADMWDRRLAKQLGQVYSWGDTRPENGHIGHGVVMRDMTEAEIKEREKERANKVLQEQARERQAEEDARMGRTKGTAADKVAKARSRSRSRSPSRGGRKSPKKKKNKSKVDKARHKYSPRGEEEEKERRKREKADMVADARKQMKAQIAVPTIDVPRRIAAASFNFSYVTQVAVGAAHACATTTAGQVFIWGNADNGRLGLGQRRTPAIKPELLRLRATDPQPRIRRIVCGRAHTWALSEGSPAVVYAWGCNSHGQLGMGPRDTTDRRKPTRVAMPNDRLRNYRVVSATGRVSVRETEVLPIGIACGDNHSLLLVGPRWRALSRASHSKGKLVTSVFSCGHGQYGQLGLGPRQGGADAHELKEIVKLEWEHVVQVVAGGRHSLAVTRNGDLYAWGDGTMGQTGLGARRQETKLQVARRRRRERARARAGHREDGLEAKDEDAWDEDRSRRRNRVEGKPFGRGLIRVEPHRIPDFGDDAFVVAAAAGGGHTIAIVFRQEEMIATKWDELRGDVDVGGDAAESAAAAVEARPTGVSALKLMFGSKRAGRLQALLDRANRREAPVHVHCVLRASADPVPSRLVYACDALGMSVVCTRCARRLVAMGAKVHFRWCQAAAQVCEFGLRRRVMTPAASALSSLSHVQVGRRNVTFEPNLDAMALAADMEAKTDLGQKVFAFLPLPQPWLREVGGATLVPVPIIEPAATSSASAQVENEVAREEAAAESEVPTALLWDDDDQAAEDDLISIEVERAALVQDEVLHDQDEARAAAAAAAAEVAAAKAAAAEARQRAIDLGELDADEADDGASEHVGWSWEEQEKAEAQAEADAQALLRAEAEARGEAFVDEAEAEAEEEEEGRRTARQLTVTQEAQLRLARARIANHAVSAHRPGSLQAEAVQKTEALLAEAIEARDKWVRVQFAAMQDRVSWRDATHGHEEAPPHRVAARRRRAEYREQRQAKVERREARRVVREARDAAREERREARRVAKEQARAEKRAQRRSSGSGSGSSSESEEDEESSSEDDEDDEDESSDDEVEHEARMKTEAAEDSEAAEEQMLEAMSDEEERYATLEMLQEQREADVQQSVDEAEAKAKEAERTLEVLRRPRLSRVEMEAARLGFWDTLHEALKAEMDEAKARMEAKILAAQQQLQDDAEAAEAASSSGAPGGIVPLRTKPGGIELSEAAIQRHFESLSMEYERVLAVRKAEREAEKARRAALAAELRAKKKKKKSKKKKKGAKRGKFNKQRRPKKNKVGESRDASPAAKTTTITEDGDEDVVDGEEEEDDDDLRSVAGSISAWD